jgi:methanesulfonate monooxygenase large subunit
MSRNAAEWAQAPSLPATHFIKGEIYYDPKIFELEKERIFDKVWLFACCESEVEELYAYRALNVGGKQIIVARGADGKIRAFYNTCSHRGAQLVRNLHGISKSFTCIYHQWSYNTLGECTAIPREDGYAPSGCSRANFGLREVRADVKLGLVFVTFDDDAEPLSDFLGAALSSLEPVLGTEPVEVFHYHEHILNANWKNWQETNSELYHEYLHAVNRRTSMREPGYHDRFWKCFPNGHAIIEGAIVDYGKFPGWSASRAAPPFPGLQPNEFRAFDLWPAAAIIMRDAAVRIDTMVPLSPTRTLLQYRGLGLKSDTPETRRGRSHAHNQIWGPFGRNLPEDQIAAESQAEPYASGIAVHGIIAREEGGRTQDDISMRQFHLEWNRRMSRETNASAPSQREKAKARKGQR